MDEPRVSANVFHGFEAFASRKGVDFAMLAEKAGLDQSLLSDLDNPLPLNAVAQILEDAAELSEDSCFGLHWAEALKPSGVLGFLLLNAHSVRNAVQLISRYVSLHIEPIDVSFEESDGVGHLRWRFPTSFHAPRTQFASFTMALIIMRLRKSAGAQWMPMRIDLEHRELACREEVQRILGPNVYYNSPVNTLHIRESVLDRRSDSADENLFNLLRKLADRMLEERKSASDVIQRTRQVIVEQIEAGAVPLEDVARRMDLAPRVLQSKLEEANTTFETVLQDTRRELAKAYLMNTDLPMTEIAFLLGFSELSAFSRAASKWFGVPPRERRLALRRPAGMVKSDEVHP